MCIRDRSHAMCPPRPTQCMNRYIRLPLSHATSRQFLTHHVPRDLSLVVGDGWSRWGGGVLPTLTHRKWPSDLSRPIASSPGNHRKSIGRCPMPNIPFTSYPRFKNYNFLHCAPSSNIFSSSIAPRPLPSQSIALSQPKQQFHQGIIITHFRTIR